MRTGTWPERRSAWLAQVERDRPAITPYIFEVAWFMANDVHPQTHEWHVGITRLARKIGRPVKVRYAIARLEERGHIVKLETLEREMRQPYRMVILNAAQTAAA